MSEDSVPPSPLEKALAAGDLGQALLSAKQAVRERATDPETRMVLFQVLALLGDWEPASRQLVAAYELGGRASPWPVLLNQLVAAEVRRERVWDGVVSPLFFGEPAPWMAALVAALKSSAAGRREEAARLRAGAMEEAPARPAHIDGQEVSWLADGDTRLGPVLEMIYEGNYYWLPQTAVHRIDWLPPTQTKDLVWASGAVALPTGATIHAHFPVRYPGAAGWSSDALRLARLTEWDDAEGGGFEGRGQRLFISEDKEYAMLDIRTMDFHSCEAS